MAVSKNNAKYTCMQIECHVCIHVHVYTGGCTQCAVPSALTVLNTAEAERNTEQNNKDNFLGTCT